MALQKRRMGKSRIHHRRSAWARRQMAANEINPSTCGNCGASKLSHRVCEQCGFYGGKQIIEVAQEGFEE